MKPHPSSFPFFNSTKHHRLEGKHYGTAADVFSFAIVMSELATLRVPYVDYLQDGDGNWIASWDQVVEMTKRTGLRPTLPDDMDEGFHDLICDCWNAEPSLRPSFSVILLRLQAIGLDKSSLHSAQKANEAKNAQVQELVRGASDLLWSVQEGRWDQANAALLVDEGAEVSALDATLQEVLASEKGAVGVKSLGWMMFGGLEDGAEIVPEPLLDSDITVVSVRTDHPAVTGAKCHVSK